MMFRLSFERGVTWLAVLAGLPGVTAAGFLLFLGDYSPRVQWTVAVAVIGLWALGTLTLKNRLIGPFRVLSNMLAALREGDYSLRARDARDPSVLGEVMREVNALGEILQGQRLGALEATALLRSVMAELVDVAIFTFDHEGRLRLTNRAGERLLGQPAERLLTRKAGELRLADCLEGAAVRTLSLDFPGGAGRWGLRRSAFREQGFPHHLVVLTDLNRLLREEERQAWQRLVRVLGHELNNSLAPIKSLAGTLELMVRKDPLPADWKDDMRRGLSVISGRAESLTRFMEAYTRVARLPRPTLKPLEVQAWIRRNVLLEPRVAFALYTGPALTIPADGDQLDQLLINLLKNAADAVLELAVAGPKTAPQSLPAPVAISWRQAGSQLEVLVEDSGPGLSNTANLFVPFFTTKRNGSGIGLVLCRQIAEAHGGSLTLENRRDQTGCVACLRLPLEAPREPLSS